MDREIVGVTIANHKSNSYLRMMVMVGTALTVGGAGIVFLGWLKGTTQVAIFGAATGVEPNPEAALSLMGATILFSYGLVLLTAGWIVAAARR